MELRTVKTILIFLSLFIWVNPAHAMQDCLFDYFGEQFLFDESVNLNERRAAFQKIFDEKATANGFAKTGKGRRRWYSVPARSIDKYLETVAPNTVEFITTGGGHSLVRVREKIYHMHTDGIHIENFAKYMKSFDGRDDVVGVHLVATPEQQLAIINYFEAAKAGGMTYKMFTRNCTQVVCRALVQANLMSRSQTAFRMLPNTIAGGLGQSNRAVARVVYTTKPKNPMSGMKSKNILMKGLIGVFPAIFGALIWSEYKESVEREEADKKYQVEDEKRELEAEKEREEQKKFKHENDLKYTERVISILKSDPTKIDIEKLEFALFMDDLSEWMIDQQGFNHEVLKYIRAQPQTEELKWFLASCGPLPREQRSNTQSPYYKRVYLDSFKNLFSYILTKQISENKNSKKFTSIRALLNSVFEIKIISDAKIREELAIAPYQDEDYVRHTEFP